MADSDAPDCSSNPALDSRFESHIDLTTEPIEWAVFDRIAEAMEVDPACDQIPVNEQINPELLQDIFTENDGLASVSFPVWNAQVTVYSDGRIHLVPRH